MALPSLSPALRAKLLFWTVLAAVPLAAFLSFAVQPLAGKLLLPAQGGVAPTWLGTMLYFQAALLAGYGWAGWLLRRPVLTQVLSVCGLALVAMFCSRLSVVASSSWTGLGGILLSLTVGTLPAMVLLFSIGPLMHGWLRRRGRDVPYFLYAFSNAGGLIAVLLYPFVFERKVGLSDQMLFWQVLLCALGGLVGIAAFCVMRSRDEDDAPTGAEETEVIPLLRIALWVGLSALTCASMLGATHHLTAEIGSSPIAWVGPFGAFLLSLLVIFSGAWQPRYTLACLGWLAVSVTGFMLTKGVSNATVDGWPLFWLMSLTAAGSFFGNGLLYETRPVRRFSFFYLLQAAGGVLGGLFVALVAPIIFLRPSEFIFLSSILLTLGLLRLTPQREVLPIIVTLLIVLGPILGLAWRQTHDEAAPSLSVRRLRNIYGCMLLEFRPGALILSNETTTRASQLTADGASRRHPTLHYTESSAVGRSIEELQKKSPSIKIGVVGLGAGTLAAYARPDDTVDFWDIDPKAVRVARDFFTFVPDSRGKVNIQQTDGRKGLEAATTDYDLIVIDASFGDAIPAHLLTREALAIYFRRLEQRQGILVVHSSNRYSTLFPIVGATAYNMFRWSTFSVDTEIASTKPDRDWDADSRSSHYLIVCRPGQAKEVASWLPEDEENGRVKRNVTLYDPQPPGRAIIWSDDRHAALDALELGRYLMGK